jgi:hypothetical protein
MVRKNPRTRVWYRILYVQPFLIVQKSQSPRPDAKSMGDARLNRKFRSHIYFHVLRFRQYMLLAIPIIRRRSGSNISNRRPFGLIYRLEIALFACNRRPRPRALANRAKRIST